MDPISLMSSSSALIGMGIQAFGMMGARKASSDINSEQKAILGDEEAENAVRRQAMTLSAQRMQTQNIRNTQRARAMGIAGAVNQGAQFGSGTAGGQGQAAAQGAVNTQGIVENFDIGNKIFGIDNQLDSTKLAMSRSMTSLSNAQGLMGLGGAITQSSGKMANVAGSIGSGLNNLFAPNLGFS